MNKFFFLLLISIIIIEFSACKKTDTGNNPFSSSDTTQWTFNGVTDTLDSYFSQTFGSFSFGNFNGDGMSFEFGSLPYGNQTYTVVSSNTSPGLTQCYLSVKTGNDNITFYSTGAPGDKVILKTTNGKEVFYFNNITVSADGVILKKVSGAMVE